MKRIGIFYNPKRNEAIIYSQELGKLLQKKGVQVWFCSAWEPAKAKSQITASDLVISIGGDGTILRAAKAIIPKSIPILGINLGKLGFLTELKALEAKKRLPDILNGAGWVEERAALEVQVHNKTLYALNDAFVGRRSSARLVSIECKIDGEPLTVYRVDGVVISTASGSTGYALASGGPILYPHSKEIILQPICPHLSFNKSLVLPPQTIIALKVSTTHEAMISLDGQVEQQLNNGDEILLKLSKYVVRFLRFQPRIYFYQSLDSKLNRKVV